jgi:hypothetical protein
MVPTLECLPIICHKHSISLFMALYFVLYLLVFVMCRAVVEVEKPTLQPYGLLEGFLGACLCQRRLFTYSYYLYTPL